MLEKRLTQKFERHFSPVETSSINQGDLFENALKDNSPKKSMRNKNERNSVQEVEIINLDA